MMRHRKRLRLAAAVLGLALVATACGDDGDTDTTTGDTTDTTTGDTTDGDASGELPEGVQAVAADGKLVVGTKFDQPLFGQQTPSGDLQGFDIEIAKIICAEMFGGTCSDDNIEFKEAVSANREPFLQQGEVEIVVATYTINDTRKELVDFAGPYYQAGQDIMVMADNDDITGIDDLNGKKVCSVDGSTSIKNLEEMAPEAEITAFDAYSKCAEALSNGQVDAVTTDNVILLGLVEQSDGEFKLVENPFTEEPYGIGVPKGSDELRAWINDVIEEICDDGRWAEAWESTVGAVAEQVPDCPGVDRY